MHRVALMHINNYPSMKNCIIYCILSDNWMKFFLTRYFRFYEFSFLLFFYSIFIISLFVWIFQGRANNWVFKKRNNYAKKISPNYESLNYWFLSVSFPTLEVAIMFTYFVYVIYVFLFSCLLLFNLFMLWLVFFPWKLLPSKWEVKVSYASNLNQ